MICETGIKDLLLIKPKVFEDHRGYFVETYNQKWLNEIFQDYHWVQDNEAQSNLGVLRGLHYQKGSSSQAKLVRVVRGKVLDIVVDLRPNSPSYGKVFGEILTGDNKWQMLVPRGFAHGYIVLEDETIFAYKCDNFYRKEDEGGINPFCHELDIDWILPKDRITLSEKDALLPSFGQHQSAL